MDWIDLFQDRNRWLDLVNVVINFRVPYNVGNFLTSRGPASFSERSLLHAVSKLSINLLLSCEAQNTNQSDKVKLFFFVSVTIYQIENPT